ncbi:uncharacterized protein LOC110695469 [Chenopodium quinoa]|uniref:uncharacterized protein LOC110695469 n=1 Tax=Chenopodium quinoa TaxID=63459 RepID=UPI000B798AAA|nr:uncharacterized protein LOC110695469 [Chenopodium quinoa]
MSFVDVKLLVDPFTPNFSYGVDADVTRGGLAVFSWFQGIVTCFMSTPNYILCNIDDGNGINRNVMFVYGEPKVEDRSRVWDELTTLLSITPNCLLIGDFNQVDCLQDKLGGSLIIKGLDAFIDWRLLNGVIDVPFSGPRYTWTNKCFENGLILERLDKVFCTNQWFEDFLEGRVLHEPIIVSDHAAITYDSDPSRPRSNRPYQLERWCLRYNDIKELASDTWDTVLNGSIEEGEEYVKLVNDIIPKCKLYFHYWQQWLKDEWIKEGDLSSTTLFNRAKQKQQRKEILTLKNDDSEWISGHDDIANLIQGALKKVFVPSVVTSNSGADDIDLLFCEIVFPQLEDSKARDLVRPFTGQEIRKAMFSIHHLKSPGPDGIIAEFLHVHWELVGKSVIEAVQHFFNTGFLLKEFNASLLVMLPKVDHPEVAAHLRPISLCNTIYKCITKCMVNRMKGSLPSLITKFQHAFIPGRYMEDNIFLSQKLIEE